MALPATLDPTSPAGTDQVSLGDDNIRAFKQFLIDFLGIPNALSCTAPGFAITTAGVVTLPAGNPTTALGAVTKQYVDGVSPIPSGTVAPFFQAAAPTGWTQVVTQNDKILRVVSGAGGGVGGTVGLSAFSAQNVAGHVLVIAEMPSHTHPPLTAGSFEVGQGGSSYFDFSGGGNNTVTNATTGSTGGDGSHNHGVGFQPAYIDMIIASKN